MLGRALETMTWVEAEEALRGSPVLLLPLGARLKEHGRHLPLNNDWVMAEYLTRRVLARCPVLALPTLQYGFYPAFLDYPGSVSIGEDTSRAVILDIARSFARHGARKLYVLNTGISTIRVLAAAQRSLADEGFALDYTDLRIAKKEVADRLREQPRGTHADELETSMMLYMAPEIVRLERAIPDAREEVGSGPLRRTEPVTNGIYSPSGAWGDPTLATREKGRLLTEAIVEHVVAAIEALADRPREGFAAARSP